MFTFPVGFFGGGTPGGGDPFWANVVLYLPLTGTNGQTTFTDVSQYGHTVTRSSDTVISTAQFPSLTGVGSSAYFDGSGDSLSIPNNAVFNFGSGDFTIEAFIRLVSVTGDWFIASASGTGGLFFGYTTGQGNGWGWGRAAIAWDRVYTSITPAVNTWYYVALTRSSGVMSVWVNGTNLGNTSNSTSYNISTGVLNISSQGLDYYLSGNVSHLRISNISRNVSIVPTAPFPIG